MHIHRFLRKEFFFLVGPFLLVFFSGFGQTYFFGIFSPSIREEFSLSYGQWGSIYSIGTITSAILIIIFGGFVDKFPPKTAILFVTAIFILTLSLMAINPFWWMLPVLVLFLRFSGQGLYALICATTIAKWFIKNRGQATALSSLGFSFGEAIFPMIFAVIIVSFSWRIGFAIAGICLVFFALMVPFLFGKHREPQNDETQFSQLGWQNKEWTRKQMLQNWLFWTMFPCFLTVPFFTTTLFFQISVVAEERAMSLLDLSQLIPMFTAGSIIGSIVGGLIIDHFSLTKALRIFLLPFAFGFIILTQASSLMGLVIAFTSIGFTSGMNTSIQGVYWPEIYGTTHHGSIRSLSISLMVFATALGPFFSGILLDNNISMNNIMLMMAGYTIVMIVILWIVTYFIQTSSKS